MGAWLPTKPFATCSALALEDAEAARLGELSLIAAPDAAPTSVHVFSDFDGDVFREGDVFGDS